MSTIETEVIAETALEEHLVTAQTIGDISPIQAGNIVNSIADKVDALGLNADEDALKTIAQVVSDVEDQTIDQALHARLIRREIVLILSERRHRLERAARPISRMLL